MRKISLPLLLLAGGLAAPALPAAAQTLTPTSSTNHQPIAPPVKFDKGGPATAHEQAPPPALPGSQANPPGVTPANKIAADMSPNDALFDAINRGDVTAARDAINRGADLGSRNVLGMSPLELSVDLARNDISFLLLSMRGEDGGKPMHKLVEAAAPPAPAAKKPGRDRHRPEVMQASARAVAPAGDETAPAAPPQRAQLFAGNGGAPIPQAGFLGFDHH